ncbi:MAG: CGNR zinc finger domain-containing protein [Frankia sp.]
MAGSTDTPRFRQGAGRLCLDFIRTLRHRGTAHATEELADPAALSAWVTQFATCEVGSSGLVRGTTQVVEARSLREAIYELLAAARTAAGAGSCRGAARDRINQAASLPVPAPNMDASGHLRWHADDPVAATLALAARDALDLAGSAAIERVRGCANPACGALFLDSSRPGTRRWCSMGTCGNLAKKETLRARTGPA